MKKEEVEALANKIVAGANPIVKYGAAGTMPSLTLSPHYPRYVRECIREFLLKFMQEASANAGTALSQADAVAKVKQTLEWE